MLSRIPCTSKVLPFTDPALLVATSTTVSPTLTFMPLAISSGTWMLPRTEAEDRIAAYSAECVDRVYG